MTAAGVTYGATVAGTAFAGTGANRAAAWYSLRQAVPARFQPRMTVVSHPVQFDRAYRAIGTESAEPPVLPDRDGALLGTPKYEWSAISSGTAAATKVAVQGDFSTGYRMVERARHHGRGCPTRFRRQPAADRRPRAVRVRQKRRQRWWRRRRFATWRCPSWQGCAHAGRGVYLPVQPRGRGDAPEDGFPAGTGGRLSQAVCGVPHPGGVCRACQG